MDERGTVTRAISIRQPWARCIAASGKTIENRGRSTSHRGPIAIHASKTPDLTGDRDPRVVAYLGPDPRLGAPVGAVIAVAELVDCHRAADFGRAGTCCAPWGERLHASKAGVVRAWHLVFDNIRTLYRPVYCPGKVMVPWTLPEDVAAEVDLVLAEAGRYLTVPEIQERL